MIRIILLFIFFVAFIGENEAQTRKKYSSKNKKKSKSEAIVESEVKKIRRVNLYLNYMKYNIKSISTENWEDYYSNVQISQDTYEDYQYKIEKTGNFSNIVSLGGGLKTYLNLTSKLKFEYGLGVDITKLDFELSEEKIDRHLISKFRVTNSGSFDIEYLEQNPRMPTGNRNYFQFSDKEEYSFISLVLPMEFRYCIYNNFDVTGGLITRIPVFESRTYEVIYYNNSSQNTEFKVDNGPLINRFLAFSSIGTRFQSNKGFTIGLSYQYLLNSFIMKNSVFWKNMTLTIKV